VSYRLSLAYFSQALGVFTQPPAIAALPRLKISYTGGHRVQHADAFLLLLLIEKAAETLLLSLPYPFFLSSHT